MKVGQVDLRSERLRRRLAACDGRIAQQLLLIEDLEARNLPTGLAQETLMALLGAFGAFETHLTILEL